LGLEGASSPDSMETGVTAWNLTKRISVRWCACWTAGNGAEKDALVR